MQTKKKTIIFTFLLVLFFILIIILYKPLTYYLNNYEELKLFLKSKGKLALFIIYFLQILQVVIAFIPSDFINLSSGYILGPYFGFLISYLGLVSGTIIAFYISRLFGKEIVLKFVKEETLNKISNKVSSNMSITNIFILSIIPFMPRDVLVYALGLTNIKPKKFLLPYLLARIPLVLILSITGDTLFKNDDYIFYFFIISLIILILYNTFKPKI